LQGGDALSVPLSVGITIGGAATLVASSAHMGAAARASGDASKAASAHSSETSRARTALCLTLCWFSGVDDIDGRGSLALWGCITTHAAVGAFQRGRTQFL
jgi:hypothetical protein